MTKCTFGPGERASLSFCGACGGTVEKRPRSLFKQDEVRDEETTNQTCFAKYSRDNSSPCVNVSRMILIWFSFDLSLYMKQCKTSLSNIFEYRNSARWWYCEFLSTNNDKHMRSSVKLCSIQGWRPELVAGLWIYSPVWTSVVKADKTQVQSLWHIA